MQPVALALDDCTKFPLNINARGGGGGGNLSKHSVGSSAISIS